MKQILEKHADDPVGPRPLLARGRDHRGLEHPGVVPVYGLGRDDAGNPATPCGLSKGVSLQEASTAFTRGTPSMATPAGAAWRCTTARPVRRPFATRSTYAHCRGVMHRDLKPANSCSAPRRDVVVDRAWPRPRGRAAGRRRVRAKWWSPGGGSGDTPDRQCVGTPALMSPEQARGDIRVWAALRHLQPWGDPLLPADRQAAVRSGGRRRPPQARQGEFPAPAALDPRSTGRWGRLPQGDGHPAGRPLCEHQGAGRRSREMGGGRTELGLARTVVAPRPRRWARRNRTSVTAAAAALFAGIVGLSAILVVQTQAKADIAQGMGRETRANEELSRSKADVQAQCTTWPLQAIKTFHTGVSEDFLLKEDRFKELARPTC